MVRLYEDKLDFLQTILVYTVNTIIIIFMSIIINNFIHICIVNNSINLKI